MVAISTGYYDTLKFFHVLAAITWVGSSIYAQVLATKVIAEGRSRPSRGDREGHRGPRQATDHAWPRSPCCCSACGSSR